MALRPRQKRRLTDMVEIDHDGIVKERGLSVKVDLGDQIISIPRSLIGDIEDDTIEVEEWFAIDKGLV